jgi:hypothetical protein
MTAHVSTGDHKYRAGVAEHEDVEVEDFPRGYPANVYIYLEYDPTHFDDSRMSARTFITIPITAHVPADPGPTCTVSEGLDGFTCNFVRLRRFLQESPSLPALYLLIGF